MGWPENDFPSPTVFTSKSGELLHHQPQRSIQSGTLSGGFPAVPSSADGDGKLFVCCYCPYSTNVKTNIRVHQRIHTGEKPYACPHCPYKSSHKSNLKSHSLRHLDSAKSQVPEMVPSQVNQIL